MRRLAPLFVAALALLGTGGTAAIAAGVPPFDGPRIVHPAVTPDFALRDQNGRFVRLSAQRGKVVVVTFLYTHCPDLCPLTAIHIDQVLGLTARGQEAGEKGFTHSSATEELQPHDERP